MSGKHRHPLTLRLTGIAALVVALIGTAAMLTVKPAVPSAPAAGGELTLEQAYPGRKALDVKVSVADGARYNPLFFMDGQRSLGTAPAADGAVRLILRSATGERELRRLPKAATPEFAGFAVQGQRLAWLELTTTADGAAETKLWALDADSAAPRLVTTDTGDVALFDKRDDVVIHGDLVTWLAAARTDTPVTEIRSAPFAGGKVTVDSREGAYAIATWPWLTTVSIGQDGPVEMLDLESQERTVVGVQANELVACSPVWCRALIIGNAQASTVIEMFKTDGSLRLRTATGNVAAATVDIALLDRWEVYSYSGGKLVVYDLDERKTITVAKGISQVGSRGPVLWWSTGDNETTAWHVLDLRTLVKS